MKVVFVSVENDLDETLKQNELLKDRLLEASLTEGIKNLVITSCVEIRNKDLHDETERISKESKDVSNESKTVDTVYNDAFEVTQELSKRIFELEKDLSKFEAKSIAFEIALQHKSRENNSLKTFQKENVDFMASLQIENLHLKQTYKDLFESVQRSRVETNHCDKVKVKASGEKQNLFENEISVFQIKIEELEKSLAKQTKENFDLLMKIDNLENVFADEEKRATIGKWNAFDNENRDFGSKVIHLEKIISQKSKDFDDVNLELSNRTAKFEAYFEKLKNTKVVLERQLAFKVDDSKAEKINF
nr:reverse transcriptase zinc-binding domain-containing protein [Tanacetum cinerariifolium]